MSKASQRIASLKSESKQRYRRGVLAAALQKRNTQFEKDGWWHLSEPITYYKYCMAWRKGFYSAGGKKFW